MAASLKKRMDCRLDSPLSGAIYTYYFVIGTGILTEQSTTLFDLGSFQWCWAIDETVEDNTEKENYSLSVSVDN